MNFHYKDFKKKQKAFTDFLTARGAQVLEPTNEWEVCRFLTGRGTSIIYKKKEGTLTFVGDAHDAYSCFTNSGMSWRAQPATKRENKSPVRMQALRTRDGNDCFFCHLPLSIEDESEEHLVAITHGGPDHLANLVLAHKLCNAQASHLSVMEKIHMRESHARI